eukprot:56411-Eustigmatos_ZCMA.PRE.1
MMTRLPCRAGNGRSCVAGSYRDQATDVLLLCCCAHSNLPTCHLLCGSGSTPSSPLQAPPGLGLTTHRRHRRSLQGAPWV